MLEKCIIQKCINYLIITNYLIVLYKSFSQKDEQIKQEKLRRKEVEVKCYVSELLSYFIVCVLFDIQHFILSKFELSSNIFSTL